MSTKQKSMSEVREIRSLPEQNIQNGDDIIRDISRRRLYAEYSEEIPPERLDPLFTAPDQIEDPADFREAAEKKGFKPSEGLLGWSTDLESPAHVRRDEIPREIETMVHEDLHRMSDPETVREMCASEPMKELYEGITEYLSEKAVEDLHGHVPGECYPEQMALAKSLADETGEQSLRAYYFRHELTDEVQRALERQAGI